MTRDRVEMMQIKSVDGHVLQNQLDFQMTSHTSPLESAFTFKFLWRKLSTRIHFDVRQADNKL